MKKAIKIVLIFFTLVLSSCQKEYNNPYDSACPSNKWTPAKLTSVFEQGIVKITWEESETHFDGFVLEKGSDSMTWISTSVGLIDKTFRSYTDSVLTPGAYVYYRISARADLNKSSITYSKGLKIPVLTPTITTIVIANILPTSALSGGTISSNGGAVVTTSGVCWSINLNPTIMNSHTVDGLASGTFTSTITGIIPGTLYYVRAYATNSAGTSYGNQLTVKSVAVPPTITTTAIANILATSALSGGTISANGGTVVVASGVCWSASENPTILNSYTADGSATGTYASVLIGLSPVTTYYVRAYATNSAGTAYGNQVTFTTTASLPNLTTTAVSGVTVTAASGGGTISSNGGGGLTASGVCWSTNQNPTILNSYSTDGSAAGNFTSAITGLSPGTLYYVRAYATNSAGTAYGNQVTFMTSASLSNIITSPVTGITSTSAASGGNITSNGGGAITVSGVCWSTNQNPTTLNSFSIDGSVTGAFTSAITGLSPGTLYYVRAYATNLAGTSYGNQVPFMTATSLPSPPLSEITVKKVLYDAPLSPVNSKFISKTEDKAPDS